MSVDAEEFEDFYSASFQRLVGQLAAMTGNHAEAQDAVQEAFVRAWERRARIDALCDRTVAQIAVETGAPSGTVKARLARGRAALASCLADHALTEMPGMDEVVPGA
jgi:DNA-directed RNA polymerase specialized sigma24 family protein